MRKQQHIKQSEMLNAFSPSLHEQKTFLLRPSGSRDGGGGAEKGDTVFSVHLEVCSIR